MYIPKHFSIDSPEAMHEIIQNHPLGVLVTSTSNGLDANHIPFELDTKREVLTGHLARANPIWQELSNKSPVLVVFRGNESYISPNWYPSKHETHTQVPTWNYEVVHVHGILTVQDDEKFVRGVVARLTRQHETSEPKPWRMGDAPPDYLTKMLGAIVGIEISITRIEGKSKLSQNREARDRLNAAEILQKLGQEALADAMRRTK
jgi:transcriptional regulator